MSTFTLIGDRDYLCFLHVLEAAGVAAGDFTVTEHPDARPDTPAAGWVVVLCVPTGRSRVYRITPGLRWVPLFETDLQDGVFGVRASAATPGESPRG